MFRKIFYFFPTFLLIILFFCQDLIPNFQQSIVVRALDGDTIDLEKGDRVRLLGIDAPEVHQPLFHEATSELKRMVEGKKVRLEKDPEWNRDKYGRLLRYVFVDEWFVNIEMIKKGFARLTADNNIKYYSDLKLAEQEAMDKKLGIWFFSP